MAVMARRVSISSPAVSQSVQGGEKIASENGYRLIEK
jgi:DNA-binding transcriptional regulator YdaS (Cro superfamily)